MRKDENSPLDLLFTFRHCNAHACSYEKGIRCAHAVGTGGIRAADVIVVLPHAPDGSIYYGFFWLSQSSIQNLLCVKGKVEKKVLIKESLDAQILGRGGGPARRHLAERRR